jgi:uncharacterized membrane protein
MRREEASGARIRRCFGACALLAIAFGPNCADAPGSAAAPSYVEARAVVDRHCVSCHSEQPTVPAFPIAPSSVVLDTAVQMQQHAERIRARTVLDPTMPLLNKTGMTEHERAVLGRWVEGGAKGP